MRVSVNAAAVPSVTGLVPAPTDTAGSGPGTVTSARSASCSPSAVHTAPDTSHARPAGTATATAASDDGSIVTVHRSRRRSTRRRSVTAPPVTSKTSFRILRKRPATSSLNARRSANALLPSCASGTDSNEPVSPGAAGVTAGVGADAAPLPAALTARTRKV